MTYQTIRYEAKGPIALLTLNRPERRNAMNAAMLAELHAAMDAAEGDEAIHAIVLCGSGRAFCSGFDLKAALDSPRQGVADWRAVLEEDFSALMRFWDSPKPTIAAVHGHCLAGGCELALACDVTLADEDAVFGEPELRFGAGIVCLLLPWLAGPKRAKEILLTGNDRIDAREALRIGLINRVVPRGGALPAALALAGEMAAMDPLGVRETKKAINRTFEIMGLKEALRAALDADILLESEGTPLRHAFTAMIHERGLKAALEWREARIAKMKQGVKA